MAFLRGSRRVPASPRVSPSIFAVGRLVYVTGDGGRSASATLTDPDQKPLATLGDGTQVTILEWRPGWRGTTLYRVCAKESGLVGWLPVGNLRETQTVPSSPSPTAPNTDDFGGPGYRIGQRRG